MHGVWFKYVLVLSLSVFVCLSIFFLKKKKSLYNCVAVLLRGKCLSWVEESACLRFCEPSLFVVSFSYKLQLVEVQRVIFLHGS